MSLMAKGYQPETIRMGPKHCHEQEVAGGGELRWRGHCCCCFRMKYINGVVVVYDNAETLHTAIKITALKIVFGIVRNGGWHNLQPLSYHHHTRHTIVADTEYYALFC